MAFSAWSLHEWLQHGCHEASAQKIVFVGKSVAGVKSEVINQDPEGVIRKSNATLIRDTVIFAINMKLVKVIVTLALRYLENEVKCGQ
ncbi:hypothetical protein [Serratia liquefaciens]